MKLGTKVWWKTRYANHEVVHSGIVLNSDEDNVAVVGGLHHRFEIIPRGLIKATKEEAWSSPAA